MKLTAKISRTSPVAAYSQCSANCSELLVRTLKALKAHNAEQSKDTGNWGHTGDLGRTQEWLAYALAALGDESGLVELGLSR